MKIKRVPRIEANSWKICEMPDLGPIAAEDPSKQDIVDHHFYRAPDGDWRLWAAIRGTGIGHPIYAWKGKSITEGPWEPQDVVLRADQNYGERVSADGDELVCAPFFIQHEGKWHCFYNSEGIHLLRSEDGYNFERVIGPDGTSRNHVGGRDPMILLHEGVYYAYSCVSTVTADKVPWGRSFVIVRTSTDLREWSDYTVVAEGGVAGNGVVSAESPFVVFREGYFYLFRSSSISFKTYVYRSETPYNFGVNDDSKLITSFDLKAPEIVMEDDQEYISDLADFSGIRVARLEWREA